MITDYQERLCLDQAFSAFASIDPGRNCGECKRSTDVYCATSHISMGFEELTQHIQELYDISLQNLDCEQCKKVVELLGNALRENNQKESNSKYFKVNMDAFKSIKGANNENKKRLRKQFQ